MQKDNFKSPKKRNKKNSSQHCLRRLVYDFHKKCWIIFLEPAVLKALRKEKESDMKQYLRKNFRTFSVDNGPLSFLLNMLGSSILYAKPSLPKI